MEEASGPPVEVFPDNWQTLEVYIAMTTQWRMGASGPERKRRPIPIGLDYGCLLGKHGVMAMLGVRRGDRPEVFDGIQIMESAALKYINKD